MVKQQKQNQEELREGSPKYQAGRLEVHFRGENAPTPPKQDNSHTAAPRSTKQQSKTKTNQTRNHKQERTSQTKNQAAKTNSQNHQPLSCITSCLAFASEVDRTCSPLKTSKTSIWLSRKAMRTAVVMFFFVCVLVACGRRREERCFSNFWE